MKLNFVRSDSAKGSTVEEGARGGIGVGQEGSRYVDMIRGLLEESTRARAQRAITKCKE